MSYTGAYYQPPLIPGMTSGNNPMLGNYAATPNPFFTVANQFLPRNLHDVIRWARFITTQSPVTTEVIRKLATYPITDFEIDTSDPKLRQVYKNIIKSYKLKATLHDIGFEYYTVGNVFVSIYFPIQRMLRCPQCESEYNAKNSDFTVFRHFEFHGVCPKCLFSGNFERKDSKSFNIDDMNIIKWDPLNIAVNHNPITNEYEYYYKIPNEIRRRVRQGDKLFVNSVPWGFVEAIKANQDFKFDRNNIFHLKNLSAGYTIEGTAVPPLITLYSLVFYQQTLRRGNEAIAQDYMTPLRVIYPAAQTGNSDPVVSISLRNFVARMKQAVIDHKRDPNHVLIAPVPIGYQAVSGEGKTLLVSQEIAQAEESILLSLGVSRELLSGTTNWTSSTVGLRLMQNTMECYTGQIEELINWIVMRTTKYLSIDTVDVKLVPFKLADDDNMRQVLLSLVEADKGALSTLYESYGLDMNKELEKRKKDAVGMAKTNVETQVEVEQAEFLAAREAGDKFDQNGDYRTALQQAQSIAQELYTADNGMRRQVLNQLKIEDYAQYLMVSKLLQEEDEAQAAQRAVEQAQAAAQQGVDPNNPNAAGPTGPGGGGSGAPEEDGMEQGAGGTPAPATGAAPQTSSQPGM